MTADPLLEVRELEVVFDGFRAIAGLDFSVREGELRFLIGPNGAGKTTLIDVITGLTKPVAGTVRFAGDDLLGRREHDIVRLGIGRTFQTATVFEQLTVLENLDLAASFRRSVLSLVRRRRDVDERITRSLDAVGLGNEVEQAAGSLSHGQKQWLEIGMLLAQDPHLLLLDEPVAGMSPEERVRTGELLQSIALTHTVVVVEHDMAFLRRFASTVTVLHEGKVLCEGSVAEVQGDPRVQEV
ncbi:MAG: urea ABC transporter ATP-binding protein UrtD, partial [Actinobacteria bacterium]|nr:urea ABC transporter ATP-binding protein UrtD [Actinomycetota bacterium]